MAKTLEEYEKILKTKTDEQQQLIGAAKHVKKELADMGYQTVEEATARITELDKELDTLETEYDKQETEFTTQFGGLLGL